MKERPILFSATMIRAILDGSKTQTRRIVKPEIRVVHAIYPDASISTNRIFEKGDGRIHCPYGQPGDRLWVRECFGYSDSEDETLTYRADNPSRPHETPARWRPSIHMPRWASRITLEVTGVRVERLQEISEADAKAEGVPCEIIFGTDRGIDGKAFPIREYRDLWESINGLGSWEANPFVWVVEFKRITP